MNIRTCSKRIFSGMALTLLFSAPIQPANAATTPAVAPDSVECLVPGQIRTIGDQIPTMGPRHTVHTSIADCQARGGEYTVAAPVAAAVAPPIASTGKPEPLIYCLLPEQLRQLGSQASYIKVRRSIRTTRSNCQLHHGELISAARAHEAKKIYLAAIQNTTPVKAHP